MNTLKEKLENLGITDALQNNCRVPACEEAVNLVEAGPDMFGRAQQMTPATKSAWENMQKAAADDGIELKLVSAFRSVDYQCEVIKRKLDAGRTIEEIMKVNAVPGHSEHHSGRALDLHCGDDEPLTEAFENSDAFAWLMLNAEQHGFQLSYPKNNAAGIDYEPWHWCFSG